MLPHCSTQSWKVSFIIVVISTSLLYRGTFSYRTSRQAFINGQYQVAPTAAFQERHKRDTSSSPSGEVFNRTSRSSEYPATGFLPPTSERKQRFCLNRLKDALQVVCSSGSSESIPQFFNPNQLNGNSSSITFNARSAKNLRNDIPAIAQQPQRRRILRRRSRRNIVRDCCMKPCNFDDLMKYCSTSVRQSGDAQGSTTQPEKSASAQQCVTVADLQSFYLKFFRKQWKKDGYDQGDKIDHDFTDPDNIDSFYNTKRKQLKEPSNTSPLAEDSEESRDVNEISQVTEAERVISSTKRNPSRNVVTAPPIHLLINLPRGSNDYIY